MIKLDVHREKQALADSEILKHKDFDALLRSYKMVYRPVYRKPAFIAGISVAAAAVIAILLYFSFYYNGGIDPNSLLPGDSGQISENVQGLPSTVSPPLASFVPKPQTFTVNAERGGKLTSSSGSRIEIPTQAFVNQAGTPLKGDVRIEYREFHNPLDVFLSGVPTHYEAKGETRYMQTAGMMEITAYQNDQPVQLDPGKNIEVELTTYFPGDCHVFYFDNSQKKWTDLGMDELVLAEAKNVTSPTAAVKQTLPADHDTTVVPALPRKADKRKHPINVDINLSHIPELAVYKKVIFEVNEQFRPFDNRAYDIQWADASIRTSEVPENYYLTLTVRDSSVTYLVYPVFESRYYNQALAVYNEKRGQRDTEIKTLNHQNNSTFANNPKPVVHPQKGDINYAKLKPVGKRHISISRMGIYNSSQPVSMADASSISPTFTDAEGNSIEGARIYIADRTSNILYNFGTSTTIPVNKDGHNLMWIVTEDGKIGILPPETFAAMLREDRTSDISLRITDAAAGIGMLEEYLHI